MKIDIKNNMFNDKNNENIRKNCKNEINENEELINFNQPKKKNKWQCILDLFLINY
jgi:hypothetical protein